MASLFAQQANDMAIITNTGNTEISVVNTPTALNAEAKYTLESYGSSSISPTEFEDEHYLGREISLKWNLFLKNYKKIYKQTVGLSGSTVEIVKPTVFNAVSKINIYYKKKFKSGTLSKDEITLRLNHILDCANLLCYENDTKKVEQDIKNAKEPLDIVLIFNSIRINYH
jgi:hypothetical protein